jgi:hypothetical protein
MVERQSASNPKIVAENEAKFVVLNFMVRGR